MLADNILHTETLHTVFLHTHEHLMLLLLPLPPLRCALDPVYKDTKGNDSIGKDSTSNHIIRVYAVSRTPAFTILACALST